MTEDRSSDAPVHERPQPAYGQYATPEEQRARIAQPDLTYALETGQDPERVAGPAAATALSRTGAADLVGTRRRRIDLTIACILLAYGVINLVFTIMSLRDFSAFADQFFRTAGIEGEFANSAAGAQWGVIGSIVLAAGWLLTAVWVLLHGRRGKLVWWIPLVGGAVSIALLTVCLSVPLMSDPAVLRYFSRTP